MPDRRSGDDKRQVTENLGSDDAARAVADLTAGDLDRCEAWCIEVAGPALEGTAPARSPDERTAAAAMAIVAYLRGDFSAVLRLAPYAREAMSPEIELGRGHPAPAPLSALPAVVLTHLATGEREAARQAVAQLDATSPASLHAIAMASLVEGRRPDGESSNRLLGHTTIDRGGRTAHRSGPAGPAAFAAEPLADLTVGAVAAAVLTGDSDSDLIIGGATSFELLAAEVAAGHRLSAAVPVSLERALGAELARLDQLERAVDVLAAAEHHWREQRAYTEVVEVLVQSADINAVLGRRDDAKRQASEAYALAERLGMHRARTRALELHHTSTPHGRDLGSPEERIVLMSDVVGSTKVSTSVGDEAYYDLVMAHHRIVRRFLADHGGVEFSEGGDSLLAWFEVPEDALDCALEILRAVTAESRSGRDLRVRLSVAGGAPFFRDGRPYGTVVNRAARLIVEAEPGQVVVDEATLMRIGPVVRGFTTRTIELDDFGTGAIGFLSP